ncbi:MAG: TetR/AcrR family transcriptional regulator [Bacteroidetes bacterium]|nr:TetR/AcrR family transcriptional regulator [Bacteroidota bacterium]
MKSNREKIEQTAIRLIGTRGYDAVSIRNITREVGIKESSFYNHFKSKESLLNEIFEIMKNNLNKIRPDKKGIENLCKEMSLHEFLKHRLDQFIKSWNMSEARYLWYVVSQQQYKNEQAASLIVKESEKSIEMFRWAFEFLMNQHKMKQGDPDYLANIYGFSIRAIHLDCTYRQFINQDSEVNFDRMYDVMENFVKQHEI